MRKEAVRVSMIDLNFVKNFLTDMQSKLLEHKDNGPVEFISESEYCGPFAKKNNRIDDQLPPVWAPRSAALLFFYPSLSVILERGKN